MALDKNISILVADDSGTMRIMFKQMLGKVGFTNVEFAVDGLDATKKLNEQKADIIISDWNMPNMDGMELLKWVRSNEKYKKIPFIMATAQGDKSQQLEVVKAGGNGHVPKPFTEDELQVAIEVCFGIKKEVIEESRKRTVIDGKVQMKVAHIQITDHLALGILKYNIEKGVVKPKYFDLETQCLPGWNPVVQLLEKGDVDAAFVLAPIAMDLFAFDVKIKLVLFAHKNGSTFVRSKNYNYDDYHSLKEFYKYKVVDIPHKMSIHNMLAHKFLTELGLKPGVPGKNAIDVRFEVVPPIKMPGIMKENKDVGGFMVAEPIASNAIAKGIGELQFISTSIWDNHPCCVVAVRNEFIEKYPDAMHEFASLLVQAGKFVEQNTIKASVIAVSFLDPEKKLGLSSNVLRKVLEEPNGIKMGDLYPVLEDLDNIQRYMHDSMNIGKLIDLEKFVDLRFAKQACKS